MKKFVFTLFVVFACSSISLAADMVSQGKEPGQNFEKHKANIISRIDTRIARNQEEKSCVQAAQKPADIKACQDKFRAENKEHREQIKK
jgi:hypothetical protein